MFYLLSYALYNLCVSNLFSFVFDALVQICDRNAQMCPPFLGANCRTLGTLERIKGEWGGFSRKPSFVRVRKRYDKNLMEHTVLHILVLYHTSVVCMYIYTSISFILIYYLLTKTCNVLYLNLN